MLMNSPGKKKVGFPLPEHLLSLSPWVTENCDDFLAEGKEQEPKAAQAEELLSEAPFKGI